VRTELPPPSEEGHQEAVLALSAHEPLPGVLLGLGRLQQLSGPQLAQLDGSLGRPRLQGLLCSGEGLLCRGEGLSEELRRLLEACERAALEELRGEIEAMLSAYPAPPAGGVEESPRVQAGLLLCQSEKAILRACAERVRGLLASIEVDSRRG